MTNDVQKPSITDILADLEVKATQAIAAFEVEARGEAEGPSMRHAAVLALKQACTPVRILALTEWVKRVALPIIRTMAGNDPVFSFGAFDGSESGMRCCFACGVEDRDDGTPFPHDAGCAHLVAQKTLNEEDL